MSEGRGVGARPLSPLHPQPQTRQAVEWVCISVSLYLQWDNMPRPAQPYRNIREPQM